MDLCLRLEKFLPQAGLEPGSCSSGSALFCHSMVITVSLQHKGQGHHVLFQTAALRREVELRMKASVTEGQTVSTEVGT